VEDITEEELDRLPSIDKLIPTLGQVSLWVRKIKFYVDAV